MWVFAERTIGVQYVPESFEEWIAVVSKVIGRDFPAAVAVGLALTGPVLELAMGDVHTARGLLDGSSRLAMSKSVDPLFSTPMKDDPNLFPDPPVLSVWMEGEWEDPILCHSAVVGLELRDRLLVLASVLFEAQKMAPLEEVVAAIHSQLPSQVN